MKRFLKVAGALVAGSLLWAAPTAAQAQEQGNAGSVLVRLRGLGVLPDERSTISAIGGQVDASNTVVPEVDVSYFFTDALAVELIAAVTKHNVSALGTAAGTVDLGKAWLLPPTLTAQYHFKLGSVEPYVGAGINYTHFFSITLPKTGPVTAISYGDSFGPAVQAGVDIAIAPRWYFNLDLKKVWLKSDVKLNGGAINASVHLDPWLVGAGIGYRF